MIFAKSRVGRLGEEIACNYLRKKNYVIVDRNFNCRWGEIDIVVKKEGKVSFIEVKTRANTSAGRPYEAYTFSKQQKLKRTINYYILQKKLQNYKLSLDVISILLSTGREKAHEIKHFQDVNLNH